MNFIYINNDKVSIVVFDKIFHSIEFEVYKILKKKIAS